MLTKAQKASIRRWYDALVSGEYQQHRGRLASEDLTAFCCLGVKCAVEGRVFRLRDGLWGVKNGDIWEEDHLPWSLAIDGETNPILQVPARLQDKAGGDQTAYATILNDDHKFTFNEIAACIRETWPAAWENDDV